MHQSTMRHMSTSNDTTKIALSFNDKLFLFGHFFMTMAWASWVVADSLDPFRADKHDGTGHMGGWLCSATVFFCLSGKPGFFVLPSAGVATVVTVYNFFCLRNPLDIKEREELAKIPIARHCNRYILPSLLYELGIGEPVPPRTQR